MIAWAYKILNVDYGSLLVAERSLWPYLVLASRP